MLKVREGGKAYFDGLRVGGDVRAIPEDVGLHRRTELAELEHQVVRCAHRSVRIAHPKHLHAQRTDVPILIFVHHASEQIDMPDRAPVPSRREHGAQTGRGAAHAPFTEGDGRSSGCSDAGEGEKGHQPDGDGEASEAVEETGGGDDKKRVEREGEETAGEKGHARWKRLHGWRCVSAALRRRGRPI